MTDPPSSQPAPGVDEVAPGTGCEHYRRGCRLVAPCCGGEAFWCRHCHNASVSSHALDRKAVTEVECAACALRQPSAKRCARCDASFGAYCCLECNFFDDDASKRHFHCADCGFCRIGGRENFFHCPTCNCCYSTSLRGNHRCVENSMHQDCPVCREFLFESVRAVAVLRCGHTIHQACLEEMSRRGAIACPLCSRTYLDDAAWASVCAQMDEAVALTPMPDESETGCARVLSACNDCGARTEGAFHVLGQKCSGCGGYNTRR